VLTGVDDPPQAITLAENSKTMKNFVIFTSISFFR